MIRIFEVENFHSLRERARLELGTARSPKNAKRRLVAPVPTEGGIPVVSLVFGANGAGKSSLLRALSFVCSFMAGRISWERGEGAPILSFNAMSHFAEPTKFYLEFYAPDISNKGAPCRYTYELHLHHLDQHHDIVGYEALRYAPKGRLRPLLERTGQEFKVSAAFQMENNDLRIPLVSAESSCLPVFAKFNHAPSEKITEAMTLTQTNFYWRRFQDDDERITNFYKEHPEVLQELEKRIQTFDLGIEKVSISEFGDKISPRFKHAGLDTELPLLFESQGTRNIFYLFPLLYFVLRSGGVAILDEFDSDLHPMLVPEILNWFYDPQINSTGAQLIAVCQNPSLLQHLTKEEIFFVEKDRTGNSNVYGLRDIQGVRRDTNIYAKYLAGMFGATPRMG